MTTLEKRGVGFRSITEAIDTTTPGGRLVFHLFGALGQFELDLIRERTRAGLKAAEARGQKGGRKPVVTVDKLKRAREIIEKGLTVREAATRLKVGKTALYEALRSVAGPEAQSRYYGANAKRSGSATALYRPKGSRKALHTR